MENQTKEECREVRDILLQLCDIILIKEDELDYNKAREFIQSLTSDEIKALKKRGITEKNKIHPVLMGKALEYIRTYKKEETQNGIYPFAFDSAGGFSVYCVKFEEIFKEEVGSVSVPLPTLLEYTLCYIQEISDHYRIFGEFYDLHVQETSDMLMNKVKNEVEDAKEKALKDLSKEIEDAVAVGLKEAKGQAETAVESAKEAAISAKSAEKEAKLSTELAIKDKMHQVTEHISTTSVTILGIFASIVLTVVAGLIYSASVFEAISSTNVYKLIIIATVVGFVCINILAAMFYYIMKITGHGTSDNGQGNCDGNSVCKQFLNALFENLKSHVFIVFVDVVLLIIMIIALLTYREPEIMSNDSSSVGVQLEGNITYNENIDSCTEY